MQDSEIKSRRQYYCCDLPALTFKLSSSRIFPPLCADHVGSVSDPGTAVHQLKHILTQVIILHTKKKAEVNIRQYFCLIFTQTYTVSLYSAIVFDIHTDLYCISAHCYCHSLQLLHAGAGLCQLDQGGNRAVGQRVVLQDEGLQRAVGPHCFTQIRHTVICQANHL